MLRHILTAVLACAVVLAAAPLRRWFLRTTNTQVHRINQ
jgi:hypothetical protein